MIRVLIIDDSALVRKLLTQILNNTQGIEVVGTASDPYFARDKFKALKPDVITLDVEMPRMDGLTFLEKLMAYKPTPVVMVSTLTRKGAETTIKALSLGAVDFVAKPMGRFEEGLENLADQLVEKVRIAAGAKVKKRTKKAIDPKQLESNKKISIDQVMAASPKRVIGNERIICIGTSTGGTVATEEILKVLPCDLPGIVIVQHMPYGFTQPYAERLNSTCDVEVVEAKTGMEIISGRAIIAQGGSHLLVQRKTGGYFVDVKSGPPVNRHIPSVDVLFRSAANSAGQNATGLILTGMGDDGAKGMKDLHEVGAFTIAQDEKSCVVFGMPKVAIDLGGVNKVVSLDDIPSLLVRMTR